MLVLPRRLPPAAPEKGNTAGALAEPRARLHHASFQQALLTSTSLPFCERSTPPPLCPRAERPAAPRSCRGGWRASTAPGMTSRSARLPPSSHRYWGAGLGSYKTPTRTEGDRRISRGANRTKVWARVRFGAVLKEAPPTGGWGATEGHSRGSGTPVPVPAGRTERGPWQEIPAGMRPADHWGWRRVVWQGRCC